MLLNRGDIDQKHLTLPSFAISRFVKEQCKQLKICRFYDPTPLFWKELQAQRRIDFKHNPHWNAHTHRILAQELYSILNPESRLKDEKQLKPDLK